MSQSTSTEDREGGKQRWREAEKAGSSEGRKKGRHAQQQYEKRRASVVGEELCSAAFIHCVAAIHWCTTHTQRARQPLSLDHRQSESINHSVSHSFIHSSG
eukprot:GHVU01120545.1.p2 GENE.GHVU01120545.1~~GHVU01120545.1.p2  ORF type:complete len:101 (+),score=16.68 GHVU01120545.1:41-343(+)